jgi:hypothetical protein
MVKGHLFDLFSLNLPANPGELHIFVVPFPDFSTHTYSWLMVSAKSKKTSNGCYPKGMEKLLTWKAL